MQSLEFSDQKLKLIKYVITDDQINDEAINELNRPRKLSMELTKTFYFTELLVKNMIKNKNFKNLKQYIFRKKKYEWLWLYQDGFSNLRSKRFTWKNWKKYEFYSSKQIRKKIMNTHKKAMMEE